MEDLRGIWEKLEYTNDLVLFSVIDWYGKISTILSLTKLGVKKSTPQV